MPSTKITELQLYAVCRSGANAGLCQEDFASYPEACVLLQGILRGSLACDWSGSPKKD
jgi:hypothetical protein